MKKRTRKSLSGRLKKKIRSVFRLIALAAGIPAAALIGAVACLSLSLPDTYYLEDPYALRLSQYRILTPVSEAEESVPVLLGASPPKADAPDDAPDNQPDTQADTQPDGEKTAANAETVRYTLMLGGKIPVKQVSAVQSDTRYVIPSGSVFGLKMLTEGAIVSSLAPVESVSGAKCPAKDAGLQAGDIILTANGEAVLSFDLLSSIIQTAGENGGEVTLTYSRGGKTHTTALTPVDTGDGKWLAGIWVRDSSAGIGTITFYEPVSGCFAALGHGVCDADTGVLLPLQWGKVCGAAILGVDRGIPGTPGELKGAFLDSAFTLSRLLGKDGVISSGTVLDNLSCGLIVRAEGITGSFPDDALTAVAPRQEVHTGEAKILSTIGGTKPQLFDAQIEKVSYSEEDFSRNMVIRITDPELIAATGGIVQGMSGSPILQNDRLVGAVTHVFVGDSERGYGIFAETMLDNLLKYS